MLDKLFIHWLLLFIMDSWIFYVILNNVLNALNVIYLRLAKYNEENIIPMRITRCA